MGYSNDSAAGSDEAAYYYIVLAGGCPAFESAHWRVAHRFEDTIV